MDVILRNKWSRKSPPKRAWMRLYGSAAVNFHHHRHNQERHDIDDLDQRVDRRAGGVVVRVTDSVTGHSGFVGLRALAAEMVVFDVLLGVVPGTAAGTHGNGDKQAGHDGAHQQAAQSGWAEQQADQNWHHHRQQTWDHHFFDRGCGQHVNGSVVLRFAGTFHDALDFLELAAYFDHHGTGSAANRFHRHGTEQIGNQAANEEPNDDHRVSQIKSDVGAIGIKLMGVVGKQH